MNESARLERTLRICLSVAVLLLFAAPRVTLAQSADDIVRKVVGNELWYSDHDHSRWMYEDDYKSPSKDQVKLVIQTPQANLSQIIQSYGRTPSPQMHQADLARLKKTVNDASYRAQLRQNERHDDQQATNLLKMLPDAFIWQIDGRENGIIRLSYHPNPKFSPPTMSSRVLAAMSGTMTVDERQMRLENLFGRLDKPVEFAWGLLGRLNAGGTFQVIRSEVAPKEWQITETHVHISGHALFFKDIGDQEDDVTSRYHPVPDGVDMEKAQQMLLDGEVAKTLGVAYPFVP
jgi:hypothetical protein